MRSLPVLATQALHRSQQELQLAMESAGMGMWFYDPATVVVSRMSEWTASSGRLSRTVLWTTGLIFSN